MLLSEKFWIESVIRDLTDPYLEKDMYIPDVAIDIYLRIAPLGVPHRHMLSVREVAELLGVHEQKVRRLIWYGHLDAVKMVDRYWRKGRVYIPVGALLAYVIKNAVINREV